MKTQMTLAEIKQGINSNNKIDRWLVFEACIGRSDVPLGWLKKGVNDENHDIRCSVFQACIGRSDVPLGWLEKGVNDLYAVVRCNAFEACIGRSDVPLAWLENGVNDVVSYVRTTASKTLFNSGHQSPLIRTFEPADKVYKQCKNDVIVVAEIPKTAQVRGSIGRKCRASEAVIVEVITGWNGCAEAVSLYDNKTTYKVGDHVVIDDFDQAINEECSTGFHFFNTREEVMVYFI